MNSPSKHQPEKKWHSPFSVVLNWVKRSTFKGYIFVTRRKANIAIVAISEKCWLIFLENHSRKQYISSSLRRPSIGNDLYSGWMGINLMMVIKQTTSTEPRCKPAETMGWHCSNIFWVSFDTSRHSLNLYSQVEKGVVRGIERNTITS